MERVRWWECRQTPGSASTDECGMCRHGGDQLSRSGQQEPGLREWRLFESE